MTHARRRGITLFAVAASLLLAATAFGHPARIVNAQAVVERDGAYRITLRFDVLAYLLNEEPKYAADAPMNALLDGPPAALERELADARERLRTDTLIRLDDGREVRAEKAAFPTLAFVEQWKRSGVAPRLPVVGDATLTGRLPPGTRTITFSFPPALGEIVLTVDRPDEEPIGEPLSDGAYGSTLPVRLTSPVGSATTSAAEASPAVGLAVPTPPPAVDDAGHGPSWWQTCLRFVRWGYLHIVPEGPDHILFVLGLFLLNAKLRPLLWQVTAFTLAHSITLALAALGIVRLPEAVVEPLIAASIAFVAIENIFTPKLRPWRVFVVFGFGLIHGLGFAGVLADAGVPQHQLLVSLISFNVGVEIGQLSVIAAAALLVARFRDRPWYRRAIVVPASVLSAIVATVWTIQRVCGI